MSVSDTICAVATATGGSQAIVRLSGPDARGVLLRAGLPVPQPWCPLAAHWPLAGGGCPCRVLFVPGPRSATGCDLAEITIPGARDLAPLAMAALIQAGADTAGPGAFTRMALAHGRITLDQAEAILALHAAADAVGVQQAIARLRGRLGADVAAVRHSLIELRARCEAGLDFAEEPDVVAVPRAELRQACRDLARRLATWVAVGDGTQRPVVALVGPPNAGKSSLFAALTGAPALVSPVPGTTRDWLEAPWDLGGRVVTLIDTAGWQADAAGLDAAGIDAGRRVMQGAALVLGCSAPDAPMPPGDLTVVATKADLGAPDPRAVVAVSVAQGSGLAELATWVADRLAACGGGDRASAGLAEAVAGLERLAVAPPADDVLLAAELAHLCDHLGEITGATTPDEVLDAIFSRFCIGK